MTVAMIETTKGKIDESLLQRKESTRQAPSGVMRAVEYWLNGELVHRSAAFTAFEKLEAK